MDGQEKRVNRPRARQSLAHIPSLARSNDTDKQNATIDLSAARAAQDISLNMSKKRTRGKSLGPGGLEVLKETDGNATKTISAFQPKSILKPTVPLTPPKSIPTFDELRQRSTRKKSPSKSSTEPLLIDFSTPGPVTEVASNRSLACVQDLADPFSPIRPMEAALGEMSNEKQVLDEDERLRQEQKKMILEQRAARRKSMANRRVSFAPEATLHTWSVMEMIEDSTTSSASNSTRRQSSMTTEQTPQRNAQSSIVDSDPPSTPPEQIEEPLVVASPAHQRDLHQKKRRRSSTASDSGDFSGDEAYSSSPSGDIAADSSPIRVEDSMDSESDTDGDTAMSMDEATQNTNVSQGSNSSSHSSLDERLRQAASQAGTRGIEYDEYGDDASMEIANDTVTHAFQQWRQDQSDSNSMDNQENIIPYFPAQKVQEIQNTPRQEEDDSTQGITMEITRVVGGIIRTDGSPQKSRRKSVAARRRSSLGRRQSIAADSTYGDETMDFTTVAGGILSNQDGQHDDGEEASDEELTMEFTTAFGGVKDQDNTQLNQTVELDENETMDMTAAVGTILPPIEEKTESEIEIDDGDEKTMAMEMTRALGHILPNQIEKMEAKRAMQTEMDNEIEQNLEQGSSLQINDEVIASTPRQFTSIASETGSPSLAPRTRSSTRVKSTYQSQTSTPRSPARNTPQKPASVKSQSTPIKQMTPVPSRAKTPERTPLSSNVTRRGASPKRLFQTEGQAKSSPASLKRPSAKQRDPLFAQDELTGRHTPRVVLHAPKPHQHLRRRSSGIGIDKEGIGSPSVTQLLARRTSIGDAASTFKIESAQAPRLRFEDPKQIAEEIDAARAEDQRRESGRFVMEQEADETQVDNETLQLKDLIESMSPKKSTSNNRSKGRKSLAVGSARGLLGKRPAELDDDDSEDNTPKRLKMVSKENSPVKKIHLPKPPSKEETTGRLTKIEERLLHNLVDGDLTPTIVQSPFKNVAANSPEQTSRYRNVVEDASAEKPASFENKLDNVISAIDPSIQHPPETRISPEDDKISLQQFLSMTNIHFIELNTTKRRQTLAQSSTDNNVSEGKGSATSSKACFVSAATTIPLLELYQHATKELKSYIAAGRKIIRSIESETLVDQPALFREYVEARPDVKLVMDNQFRNGKTNARLQSKEGWYTWRSQLEDGLATGLRGIQRDLEEDLMTLTEQSGDLAKILPDLLSHRDSLKDELPVLQQRLEDIDSVDHHALKLSRRELRSVDDTLAQKLATLDALQQQIHDKDEMLAQAAELKQEMQAQIDEADRVREEQRGWAAKDVLALKSKVDTIKTRTGWSILSAEEDHDNPSEFGVALTMSYKDTLRLFFYPSAYEQSAAEMRRRSGRNSQLSSDPTAPISLTFSRPHDEDTSASHLPTEQRFFLQLIQSQLHTYAAMPKGVLSPKIVLDTISSTWETALEVTEELRLLKLAGMTTVSIHSDERLGVKLMLVTGDKSRVDIAFDLVVMISDNGHVSVATSVTACAIYGPTTTILNAAKTRKVQTALSKEVENKPMGTGAWVGAIRAFEEWHRTQLMSKHEPINGLGKAASTSTDVEVAAGSTTPKSPMPAKTKTPATKRSPLAAKKSSIIQKKTIPVPTSRQDKFRTSQREQVPQAEKPQIPVQEDMKGKENLDPFSYGTSIKAPAITPEMQEAMMQRTPIKRVGALRRSPI